MKRRRHHIRACRVRRGLPQAELARRIGIGRSNLGAIERDERRYDQQFIEAAADALGCSAADVILGDPDDPDSLRRFYDQSGHPIR